LTPYRVAFITASTEQEAERLAKDLVGQGLAACVNIIEPVRSIYRWEGELCDEREVLLIVKTHVARVNFLIDRVREIHSYQVPEVIVLPIEAGHKPYLSWIDSVCGLARDEGP
jgi:periplasmic divalent cation tolerance protein